MPKYPHIINRNITFDLFYSDDPSFSGDTKYTDKGIDFKIRLFEESYWLPETAIGVRDFGGTGLFDGEFIAASKHIGPFDFTVGVGWGYMGNSGNLSGDKTISNDCGRDTSYKGKGGSVNFERWFTDCSAVFGGVEYQSPWAPLRLKAEYDGSDYISDFPVTRGGVDMTQDSKFNYGMLYRFGDWGDARLSYERGNTWTLGFTLNTNFNDLKAIWQDEPLPAYLHRDTHTENLSDADWLQLAQGLHQIAGYEDPTIYTTDDTVTPQTKYRDRNEAHKRAAIVIANQSPETKEYRLIETSNHQAITETRIDSEQYAKVAQYEYFGAKVEDSATVDIPEAPQGSNWAIGLDANYVTQRDPDSQFGFFTEEVQFAPLTGCNYRVQTGAMTGHLTAYYQPQWEWLPNTLFKVSAGAEAV